MDLTKAQNKYPGMIIRRCNNCGTAMGYPTLQVQYCYRNCTYCNRETRDDNKMFDAGMLLVYTWKHVTGVSLWNLCVSSCRVLCPVVVVVPVSLFQMYSPPPNSPFLVPRAHPTFQQTTCTLEKNVAVVDVVDEENQDVLPNEVPHEEKVISKNNLVLKKKA